MAPNSATSQARIAPRPASPVFAAHRTPDGWRAKGVFSAELGASYPGPDGSPAGLFARWEWDGATVSISRDPYSFYPLYAWHDDRHFALSPSLSALLRAGAPREIDEDALALFLRLGYYVGTDTPFRAIRALPASRAITWRDGRLNAHGAWPRWAQPLACSRDDALERLPVLLLDALSRMRPTLPTGPLALPLSGGRDSRHILLALDRLGRRPDLSVTALYYPPWGSEDAAVAQQVAAAAGIPCHVVSPPYRRLPTELLNHVSTNLCADEHSWFHGIVRFIAETDCRSLIDGLIGGNVARSTHGEIALELELRRGHFDPVVDDLLAGPSGFVLSRILRRSAQQTLQAERARARLKRELAYFEGDTRPLQSFLIANRARREVILMNRLLPPELVVQCPFGDPAVMEFMMAVPVEQVDAFFHNDAIARAYPAYASIPFARDKHESRHLDPAQDRRYAADLLAYALRHPPRRWLDPVFLFRRLAQNCTLARWARSMHHYGQPIAYLLQLEQIADGADPDDTLLPLP